MYLTYSLIIVLFYYRIFAKVSMMSTTWNLRCTFIETAKNNEYYYICTAHTL